MKAHNIFRTLAIVAILTSLSITASAKVIRWEISRDFRWLDYSLVDNEIIADCVNCIDDTLFGKKTIYMKEVCRLVNIERMARGLNPVCLDAYICKKACTRASEINKKFSHTRPNGESCFTVLDREKVGECLGENIAKGYPNAAEVVWGWMHSRGHRKNILNPNYTLLGVGFNPTQNSWVQLFSDDIIKNHIPIDSTLDYAGREIPDSIFGKSGNKIKIACDIINQYRIDRGLEPLELDPLLCKSANTRAKELSKLFSNLRPPTKTGKNKWIKRDFDTALKKKYTFSLIAEAVFKSKYNPYDAIAAQLEDTKVFVSDAFGKIGIGYDRRTGAWVEIFADADAGME